MNLRRYRLLGIVVAFAIGVVAGLVIFGAQPNAVRHSGGLTVPGNTVTFAAVDQSGQYGTITVTRRGQRPVRADEQQQVADTGGAITVVEVHVAYLPERATDTGFGYLDWQVWVDGTLEAGGAQVLFPALRISGAGRLPNQLHGNAEVSGLVAVPIPRSAVGKAVYLVYAPNIEPVDNGFDRKVITRVKIWGP